MNERGMAQAVIFGLLVLTYVAIVAGAGYVAIHFIVKFW